MRNEMHTHQPMPQTTNQKIETKNEKRKSKQKKEKNAKTTVLAPYSNVTYLVIL